MNKILMFGIMLFASSASINAQQLPRTANHAWWFVNAASLAATVADVENTQYCLHSPQCREGNPLFGPRPSRGRAYAISLPLAGLATYLSYRWKKQDDADFLKYHKYYKIRWWAAPVVNVAAHGVGIAITFGSTGR